MKTVTIRMDEELASQLESEGNGLNKAIVENLKRYYRMRLVSEMELKGVFTPKEWMFFFYSLNGLTIDENLSCNVGVLIAHCEDAEKYEGLASRFDVDIEEVKKKISSLKGANIQAIYSRAEKFWKADGDINEWSNF